MGKQRSKQLLKNLKTKFEEGGRFIPLFHQVLQSEAYRALPTTARLAYSYFLMDIKNDEQEVVILTFPQSKKWGICKSSATFTNDKKELVAKGFLNPYKCGGNGVPSSFKLSRRWKRYNKDGFKKIPFIGGISSKYFSLLKRRRLAAE